MSKFKKYGLPCPKCSSSDAYAIDHNGVGFCFSCKAVTDESIKMTEDSVVEYVLKPHRGLSQRTVDLYDIKIKVVDGQDYEYGFVHPNGAVKTKRIGAVSRESRYRWIGSSTSCGLFGQDKFPPGSKPAIIVTEGEHDAPSCFETMNEKYAAVSIQSSSTALRDITNNREYLNSFDKIILAFDNDNPGKEALKKVVCSGLFDFNKLYYVEFKEFKDANDYLKNNQKAELATLIKQCKKYTPDNIISTKEEIKKALEEAKEELIGTYPLSRLTEMLYGLYRGQVVVIKGLEGIGKTEILRMMEFHLLKSTSCKLGLIHMEEDKSRTIKGIATYQLECPVHLPDVGVSNEDIATAYMQACGDREDRVFIYTLFGGDNPDDVLDSIRFLVASCGVDIIFLDHITMMVTGVEEGDERRKLDYLSTKLKKMAKELRFCLVMISHVNDDGQTRGSRNITKIADTVINLSRPINDEDEGLSNNLFLDVDKNRLAGSRGKAGYAKFNTNTYMLEEPEDETL